MILEICQKEGYIPLALSVQPGHVHMFVGLEPKHSISDVVKELPE
ncbi:MAG: transposase [candidate division WOR-3 bacterium]